MTSTCRWGGKKCGGPWPREGKEETNVVVFRESNSAVILFREPGGFSVFHDRGEGRKKRSGTVGGGGGVGRRTGGKTRTQNCEPR